ncbi:type II and III secretion system protein family protein [Roseospirillum parvum]|uniref:Pilus assembly protein CpaC n=1 Tax=Roseospirillum parvum TaxID=83401 RepID=A0A1G8C008_9PROT|nr:type II and III secretion system protein family protein [Roseospirillum parvum]SDH38725.1 pilus assembly protein CpaC [Roseospirillum parvum]
MTPFASHIGRLLVLVALGVAVPQPLLAQAPPEAGGDPAARTERDRGAAPTRLDVPDRVRAAPVTPVEEDDGPVVRVRDGEDIQLPVGTSRLLKLPVPVRDVVIGNPDVVEVIARTPTEAFLMARGTGITNVFFLDVEGRVVLRSMVSVVVDVDGLRATLSRLLPNEPIQVEATPDSVYLRGRVSSDSVADQALRVAARFAGGEGLVNLLSVGQEQQVLLQVRVAEVARNTLKELGINFNSLGADNINTTIWNAATTASALDPALTKAVTLGLSGIAGGIPFDLTIRALEERGLVRTLAEPNLTAVSGEAAELVAGGEYPFPVADGSGGVTIEFRPYGVAVSFTPVVLSDGRISLRLSSEVSSIDTAVQVTVGGNIVNGFKVRRANTAVELPSGGSLMIAGLLQNETQQNLNGVPGLMDLPILGNLFSSKAFQRDESELVIMVTCYLVDPVQPGRLATATDGFAATNDLDFYLLNRLHHLYTGKSTLPANGVVGPIGYIVR